MRPARRPGEDRRSHVTRPFTNQERNVAQRNSATETSLRTRACNHGHISSMQRQRLCRLMAAIVLIFQIIHIVFPHMHVNASCSFYLYSHVTERLRIFIQIHQIEKIWKTRTKKLSDNNGPYAGQAGLPRMPPLCWSTTAVNLRCVTCMQCGCAILLLYLYC